LIPRWSAWHGEDERGYALFEYEPAFLKKGMDISPLHMGLAAASGGASQPGECISFSLLLMDKGSYHAAGEKARDSKAYFTAVERNGRR
jgi:hypothetical protein